MTGVQLTEQWYGKRCERCWRERADDLDSAMIDLQIRLEEARTHAKNESDRCERIIAQRDAARAVLRSVEWAGAIKAALHDRVDVSCPSCKAYEVDFDGTRQRHKPDCALAAALGKAGT